MPKPKIKQYLFFLFLLFVSSYSYAQELSQTIRGTILDKEGQFPLIGATVALSNTDKGTITDAFGKFRIEQVPLGRYEIVIAYLGYEQRTTNNS